MISTNPISAPQVINGNLLFSVWKKQYSDSKEAFYDFLTTPSHERDQFLEEYKYVISLEGNALVHTVKGSLLARDPNVKPVNPGDVAGEIGDDREIVFGKEQTP